MPTNRRRRRYEQRDKTLDDLTVSQRHAIEQGSAPRYPYYGITDEQHLRRLWREFGAELIAASTRPLPALEKWGSPQ